MNASRPINVCFVMPVAERLGGAETMLWLFLRDVDRSRVEPSVVFLRDGPFFEDCHRLGIPSVLIPSGRLRQVRRSAQVVAKLASHFRRSRPDLIVQWFGKTHFWVWPAATAAGLGSRVIWWQHSVPEGDRLVRLTTLLPARAIGAESAAAADVQGALWPHHPTFVVHTGIDDVRRPDAAAVRRATRSALGVSDDEVLVGMIARVQRWKGQHHLLEAIAELRSQGLMCRGLMVGGDAYGLDPGYNREVSEQRRQLGLEDVVIWIDQVPNPVAYLYAIDVFVNASVRENLSLALLEAMAAERCIVAVADGGTPEALTHERTGILIPKSDSALLASALGRVCRDTELRVRLGLEARRDFEARFTAQGWVRTLEDRLQLLTGADYVDKLKAVARKPR
jgi:glycosyltransferase involved in cell wall biosynthesis